MRALHDAEYGASIPTGTVVIFNVLPGITLLSSELTPALATGSWPAGTTLILNNFGNLWGKGGDGGNGGSAFNTDIFPGLSAPGKPGENGGDGFIASYAVTVNNQGSIAAGAGGGGGAYYEGIFGTYVGGGGGGGGVPYGAGGSGGGVGTVNYGGPGTAGTAATATVPGVAGAGYVISAGERGGDGGDGGEVPLPMAEAGGPSIFGGLANPTVFAGGGTAGAHGRAVVGNSNITWASMGTIVGSVV